MFASLAQAVAGDEYSDEEEEQETPAGAPTERAEQPAAGGFNLWGIANAVAETVKKGTAELATTVRETDWRAEIQAFGRDVVEETEELGQSAISVVEHAVEHVEHLPQHAQTALPVIEERRRQVQQQLGQYGTHIGRFGREIVANTTELFEQARDTIQQEMSAAAAEGRPQRGPSSGRGGAAGAKYSRLDSDIAAMQRDSSTYCDEPADTAAYSAWLQTFDLAEKKPDIDAVVRDNTFMAELQARIVPLIVEHDTFWRRYFYRLHLLKEAHAQRTALAARAAAPPEEEVGWDDDDPASPQAAQPTVKPQPPAQEAGQPSSLSGQAQGSRGGDSSPVSSGIAVSATAQPSDEEPATASDSSSGADPWTVVTSPSRRTAPSLPAAVPEAAAQPAAEAEQGTQPVEDVHAENPGSAGAAEGGPAAAENVAAAAADQGPPAPPAQPPASVQESAAVAQAEPAAATAAQQTAAEDADDNDDDLGDIEAAPNDDDDDVDEDWGYEST